MNTSTEESSAPPRLCNRAKGIGAMTLQISRGRGWNVNPFRNKRGFFCLVRAQKVGLFRRLCHSFSEPKTKMYFVSMSCLGAAWFDSLGRERKEAAARCVYSKTNSSTLKHQQAQIECRSAVSRLVSVGVRDNRKDEVRGLSVCTPGICMLITH